MLKELAAIIFCLFSFIACSENPDETSLQRETADSLNIRAAYYLDVNQDSSLIYARKAYRESTHYEYGKAEALIWLGKAYTRAMKYDKARMALSRVLSLTDNKILLYAACVAQMDLCRLVSNNKAFYDFRSRAMAHAVRINEDYDRLSGKEAKLFGYSEASFNLITASYGIDLQLGSFSMEAIDNIDPERYVKKDTTLLLPYYYFYTRTRPVTGKRSLLQKFDACVYCLTLSQMTDNRYWEARSLIALGELLAKKERFELFERERHSMLNYLAPGGTVDRFFPEYMADKGLSLAREYKQGALMSSAYRVKASFLMAEGHYEKAITRLHAALNLLGSGKLETKALIYEQLSVAYAAINKKKASDYYRNAYIDLLERTRQDRAIESRYDHLVAVSGNYSWWIYMTVFLILVSGVFLYFFNRHWTRKHRRRVDVLHKALDWSDHLTAGKVENMDGEASPLWEKDKLVVEVLASLTRWSEENRLADSGLSETKELIEEKIAITRLQLRTLRRKNIECRAKAFLVSGFLPYIDLLLYEIRRMADVVTIAPGQQAFLADLLRQICDLNDVLTRWIQLEKGEIALHIENFPLSSLFDILGKGNIGYIGKGIEFQVIPTDVWVKADKALTLFMLNTLTDNARKFTGSGGKIRVEASEAEEFVEIVVLDTGKGISEEDKNRILNQKIVRLSDGHGFGLMNCKGIIEKYRKSGQLFRVCSFNLESKPGEGSRFSFRLPKGVRKTLLLLSLIVSSLELSAKTSPWFLYDALSSKASDCADSAYYSNIRGTYEQTLLWVDSVCYYLNHSQETFYGNELHPEQMVLSGTIDDTYLPAEIIWWKENRNIDFRVILDARNECAIAALALHKWDVYMYNNKVYISLYRYVTQDKSLERSCRVVQRAIFSKSVLLTFLIIAFLVLLVGYYVIYLRHRILLEINLRQLFEINKCVTSYPDESLAERIYSYIAEIYPLKGISIRLDAPDGTVIYFSREGDCSTTDGSLKTYPLSLHKNGYTEKIGTMIFKTERPEQGTEIAFLNEWIVRCISNVLYRSIIVKKHLQWDVELAEDEYRRISYEVSQLHVQNAVIDNCLSTIKHETIYYPSKMQQYLHTLSADNLKRMDELLEYYKDLLWVLIQQTERQTAKTFFEWKPLSVSSFLKEREARFSRRLSKVGIAYQSVNDPGTDNAVIYTDESLLDFLLDTLLSVSLSVPMQGFVSLRVSEERGFIKISYEDSRLVYTPEEAVRLFSPEESHIPFLICKQIIREHEKIYSAYKGCRINIERLNKGSRIWFTIPKKN